MYILIPFIISWLSIVIYILWVYLYNKFTSTETNIKNNLKIFLLAQLILVCIGLWSIFYTNTFVETRCFAQKTPFESYTLLVLCITVIWVFIVKWFEKSFLFLFSSIIIVITSILFFIFMHTYSWKDILLCQQPAVSMTHIDL